MPEIMPEARHEPNVVTKAKYTVELADSTLIKTNRILKGFILRQSSHKLNIDIMTVALGCFDVVVGMDWLAKNQVESIR